MVKKDDYSEKLYMVYIKAIIRGILLSVVLLLISAFIFYYSSLKEDYMSTVVWIITVIGICYSSIFGSYKIGRKGLIHGIAIGIIYTAVLGVIAILADKGQINSVSYMIMLAMSIVIGALSGIIGSMLSNK